MKQIVRLETMEIKTLLFALKQQNAHLQEEIKLLAPSVQELIIDEIVNIGHLIRYFETFLNKDIV